MYGGGVVLGGVEVCAIECYVQRFSSCRLSDNKQHQNCNLLYIIMVA